MAEAHEYEQYGRDALEGTRSGWVRWRDEGYGSTVAVVVGGEVGDALADSNTATAERLLADYLESGDAEHYTVGRSGRTWLRGIAVRVFDDAGEVTAAWRDAVDLVVIPLEDYPLLDEDDYSERRYEVHLENLRLEYGEAADLVAEALSAYSSDPEDAWHDEVCEAVDRLLDDEGRTLTEAEADGLRFYVRQRVVDLDIPTLAAQVLEEVEA
jgi:hypothetical protein